MESLKLHEITIEVSVLILCIEVIRILLQKKMNSNMRYFLWIFVAIRILLPFQLEIPVGIPAEWVNAARLAKGLPEAESLGLKDAVGLNNSAELKDVDGLSVIAGLKDADGPKDPAGVTDVRRVFFLIEQTDVSRSAASVVWLCGVLAVGGYLLYGNIKLNIKLKRERKIIGRLGGRVSLYAVPAYNCLAGVFHPAVYVDGDRLCDEAVIKNIIRHELQHYHAGDHYWQLIRLVCLVMQWHNPFVWWAYFSSKRDCELACDARVTKYMSPEKRYAYGNSLLAVLEGLSGRQKINCTTSMGGSRKFIEKRLKAIMKNADTGNVIVSVAAAAVIGCICLTSFHICIDKKEQSKTQGTESAVPENSDGNEDGAVSAKEDSICLEDVLAMRAQVLEGMSGEDIERLTENIKVANQQMEWAYLQDNIFEKLKDKKSLLWNYFDEKGEIQVGWSYEGSYQEMRELIKKENLTLEEFHEKYGTPVMTYNRFHAENFMKLMEEMKEIVYNEELKKDLQKLIDEAGMAVQTHEVEHAENIYRILHDMDYYLLRYGPEDVGKYVRDISTVSKYYGVLEVYR